MRVSEYAAMQQLAQEAWCDLVSEWLPGVEARWHDGGIDIRYADPAGAGYRYEHIPAKILAGLVRFAEVARKRRLGDMDIEVLDHIAFTIRHPSQTLDEQAAVAARWEAAKPAPRDTL